MGVEGGDDEDERAYAKWGESWGTYLQDVYEAQRRLSPLLAMARAVPPHINSVPKSRGSFLLSHSAVCSTVLLQIAKGDSGITSH